MIEARVECECSRIVLSDLGIAITHREIVYVEVSKAKASKDLQRAWRAGAVTIRYVQRYQERRDAPPMAHHPLAPTPRSMIAAPDEPEIEDRDVVLVDPGEIAAKVVVELGGGQILEHVQLEVGRQIHGLEERVAARVVDAMVNLLGEGASSRTSLATRKTATVTVGVVDDVPVFVPSHIGGDLQANLGLESQQAGDSAVSDAAAALRASRKGKSTKPSKQ